MAAAAEAEQILTGSAGRPARLRSLATPRLPAAQTPSAQQTEARQREVSWVVRAELVAKVAISLTVTATATCT